MKNDKVKLNIEAIEADVKKLGLTYQKVSRSIGKNDGYVKTSIGQARAGRVFGRDTVELIERALFREPGAYCIEIDEEEQPEAPQGGSSTGSDIEKLRKEIADMYVMQKALYDELRSLHSDMKELVFAIKCDVSTTKEYARRTREDTKTLTELWGAHS